MLLWAWEMCELFLVQMVRVLLILLMFVLMCVLVHGWVV